MKTFLITFTMLFVVANNGFTQQWQTMISVDSRIGYSSNTFLNSFLSEWNTTAESPYNITSLFGKTYWHKNRSSISLTGGVYYEPVFESSTNWRGAIGLLDMNHRISNNFRVGFEGGANYLNGNFSRSISWLQPKITWFVTPFTLIKLKTGSNFRNYQNYSDSGDSYNRLDLYSLELETWPSYRWQLTAGLYGSLDTLPAVQEGFNANISAGYYFQNGANLNFKTGVQQYQLSSTTTDGGGGGPPGGGLPNQTTTTTDTDRIFRAGVEASIPMSKRLSLFSTAEMLYLESESSGTSRTDFQTSAGVRLSFEPQFNRKKRGISPEWEVENRSQKVIINYPGEGQLYLVGTFNNWNKPGIPLSKQTENTYVATLSLAPGAYEYRVLRVQGKSQEWLDFSDDTYTVDDGFESENAMLLVEQ